MLQRITANISGDVKDFPENLNLKPLHVSLNYFNPKVIDGFQHFGNLISFRLIIFKTNKQFIPIVFFPGKNPNTKYLC